MFFTLIVLGQLSKVGNNVNVTVLGSTGCQTVCISLFSEENIHKFLIINKLQNNNNNNNNNK